VLPHERQAISRKSPLHTLTRIRIKGIVKHIFVNNMDSLEGCREGLFSARSRRVAAAKVTLLLRSRHSEMTTYDIARQRLHSQHLTGADFETASQVVQWMGAVQSQDYSAAKWAIAQRTRGLADSEIEQAFIEGTILRTHVMRPTWHFVTREDIRWLLALTAPRVHAVNAYYYRRLELDKTVFKRSNATLIGTLQGGRQLTRAELASALRRAGIAVSGLRLVYLIVGAELDGVICSGARRGKQFTYALLDERVPTTKTLAHDEALAEFTRRYFTSRGPATEEDFMWWSGLTRADVRSGLEMVKDEFEQEVIAGKTYWSANHRPPARDTFQTVHLLPNYDEYVVGYADRSAIFDSSHADQLDARHNPLFQHTLVINGQVAGTWKRTLKKDSVVITPNLFARLKRADQRALAAAARQYGAFLGLPAEWPKVNGRAK